ncbi:hypothetical protein [Polaromonas sp. A23]|uniref:hypothetical protein n=1 Tax=Polaromonas sp. A23 TaxID=1944133 RepID=UPI0011158A57|nr:hypothetical protein [Polaromonas sp. A23]
MKNILSILAAAAISGCASGPLDVPGTFLPPQHYQALASAPLCCKSYGDIHYAPLQRGRTSDALVLPTSPVFEFDGRRSFFAAFELAGGVNRILTVTTEPVNLTWNPVGHVMVPSVLFLDPDHKKIELVQPQYAVQAKEPGARALLTVPNGARYAVLLSGTGTSGISWPDSDQRSGQLFIRSGPTGKIGVLLLGG